MAIEEGSIPPDEILEPERRFDQTDGGQGTAATTNNGKRRRLVITRISLDWIGLVLFIVGMVTISVGLAHAIGMWPSVCVMGSIFTISALIIWSLERRS